jgi:hypothetical protein
MEHVKANVLGPCCPQSKRGAVTLRNFALYILRSLARVQYGFTEIMFGIVAMFAASNATKLQTDKQTMALQVAASIYIVIRGLDNVRAGIEKYPNSHPTKRLWNDLFGHDGLRLIRRWKAMPRLERLKQYRRTRAVR